MPAPRYISTLEHTHYILEGMYLMSTVHNVAVGTAKEEATAKLDDWLEKYGAEAGEVARQCYERTYQAAAHRL